MSSPSSAAPPKVFISYSWTSDEHSAWVADLGQRLMADGVDVVLDQWSLKHGQDVNCFMEQMVLDPTIKRVLIISDALYAEKANTRKGGVGTESQIISEEVYEKVDQQKFIPILRERDADGKPCLPVFLKSRMYLDFSDANQEPHSYDALLRNIFDRPVRPKPPLGKPPSHLFDDSALVIPAAQKAKRFQEVLSSGKGNPSAAFEDFAEEFLINFNDLRLTFTRDQETTWCDTLSANIETGRQYRDICIDVIRAGIAHIQDAWFMDAVTAFLERLVPFQFRPASVESSFEISEDNYKFLVYEFFIYIFAAFVKTRRYAEASQLLDYTYVSTEKFDGGDYQSFSFAEFNDYVKSLDDFCNKQRNLRRVSLTADKIVERATRSDLKLSDVMQADAICALASVKRRGYLSWFPRTIIYAGHVGKLELFARAVNEKGFAPLRTLVPVVDARELLTLVNSKAMRQFYQSHNCFRVEVHIRRLFNLQDIAHAWGIVQAER
jgi:hypothetical protein